MSAALVLSIGTAILAVSAGLLRERRAASTAVSLVGVGLLAAFVLLVRIDEPFNIGSLSVRIDSSWTILGRSLVIDETNRTAVGFLYLIGGFMIGGTWATPGTYYLPSVGLIALNVVSASLMVRPFLFAAVFVELAAMAGVLILLAGRSRAVRGSLRLLTTYTLGMIVLLWAGWMVETGGITAGSPEEALRATTFMALGFAIVLGVPPFHLWLVSSGEEANPFSLNFVTLMLQSAGLFLLLHTLNQYAWLRESEELFAGIRLLGAIMVLFGGLMAVAQVRIGKMLAYALIADYGINILAVGTGTADGFQLAIGHVGARVVSFSLWALGIALLVRIEGDDNIQQLKGSFWRYPFVASAALVGLFSAGGFPLTAGFPGRWAVMTIMAPMSGITAAAALLGMAAIGLGGFRWMMVMVRSRDTRKSYIGVLERSFLVAGISLCVVLGLFPQLSYPLVVQAAAGLSNLIP
jgi:formate hydrogenlyase subunit 3/multisubunit Na+/H+ antiporter MnhD subunit